MFCCQIINSGLLRSKFSLIHVNTTPSKTHSCRYYGRPFTNSRRLKTLFFPLHSTSPRLVSIQDLICTPPTINDMLLYANLKIRSVANPFDLHPYYLPTTHNILKPLQLLHSFSFILPLYSGTVQAVRHLIVNTPDTEHKFSILTNHAITVTPPLFRPTLGTLSKQMVFPAFITSSAFCLSYVVMPSTILPSNTGISAPPPTANNCSLSQILSIQQHPSTTSSCIHLSPPPPFPSSHYPHFHLFPEHLVFHKILAQPPTPPRVSVPL